MHTPLAQHTAYDHARRCHQHFLVTAPASVPLPSVQRPEPGIGEVCSKHLSSVTTPPSQVPLYKRLEVLQLEPNYYEGNDSSILKMLPRLSWPML